MAVLKIKDGNTWASITTIKGDTGPQGPQGVQGPQGEAGPAGSYNAGNGISIVDDTVSLNIEYLTNSDILAIWNS